MKHCFWCGEKLGLLQHTGGHDVGGVKAEFHVGLFKDCRNEFLKWQKNGHQRLERIAFAAGQVH